MNVPYDFDSVMHYASKAFNGRNVTIQPLDPNQKIGQRKVLSKLDALQLNLMYKCPGIHSVFHSVILDSLQSN